MFACTSPVTPLAASAFAPKALRAPVAPKMLGSIARRALRSHPARVLLRRPSPSSAVPNGRRCISAIPVASAAGKGGDLRPVSARAVSTEAPSALANAKDEQANAPSFQEAIQRLQEYWASHGCCLFLPHNTEVGAGTMNPATFLRVLGPEPWNVAYPEPSVRPDDSRYGDNPNRVQRHTQFQVILKPDPGNAQELYLGSLKALGIDTEAHDIRFVEDNWESPVLGAWGLGWEVWLDGMEVTQFTYFQQAGSLVLPKPAVEITYGLERIMMSLQGVNHFKDIKYSKDMTYGELFLQNEAEMSAYNLDAADLDRHRKRFELFDLEARDMIERRLPIPAYDHILKLSHAFNVLDARGAVGVTERAKLFGTMRTLARQVSKLWVERREELEFPMGIVPDAAIPKAPAVEAPSGTEARDFVLEIGSEELPPQDVDSGIKQLQAAVPALLKTLGLEYDSVSVEGTPRRLAVVVAGLAAGQPDKVERARGPPADRAFKDGAPTKAAEGFCKKNGISVDDVIREADAKGTEYIWADVKTVGRPAAVVLAEELPGLVGSLSFGKSMRWSTATAYSRPMRWIVALHGDTVVPFVYGDVLAGNTTRLLRNSPVPEVEVASAEAYSAALGGADIVLGVGARRGAIWEQAGELAAGQGGKIPESAKSLLEEVANLVEAPTPLLGSFDASFLSLPKELLVMVMKKHQRYFHIEDAASGELLPYFVTVANGGVDVPTVRGGNEAVLRARYEDAKFFYANDSAKNLGDFRPELEGTTFQADIGSMLDKSRRLEALAPKLAKLFGTSPEGTATAEQAAPLAHCDLVTSVVMEFTALAGTMGKHYAEQQGLPGAVSEAVFEFVLPRSAGDDLPRTEAGALLSAADRLDSLVGLFAAGCAPTASADPFGLRRAALGLVGTLVENDIEVDLAAAVEAAASELPIPVPEDAKEGVVAFVQGRLQVYLVDRGVSVEQVRAVLAERGNNPALAARTALELKGAAEGEDLLAVLSSLARAVRIIKGKDVDTAWEVDPALFDCDEERALWAAYGEVAGALEGTPTIGEFVAATQSLVAPVDTFFENVFVMAEDEAVRKNRFKMLHGIAGLVKGVIDPTELPGF